MKKNTFLIFILLVILYLIIKIISGSVTGQALQSQTNVSIFVEPSIPIIRIYNPQSQNYQSPVLLNYSIRNNFSSAWYNIDNLNNISLPNLSDNSLTFSTSEGTHILYLYANNTFGTSMANVTFIISSQSPSDGGSSSGGGGSGGSGGGGAPLLFQVDKTLIESSVFQGENKLEIINIKNIGSQSLEITFDLVDLDTFVIIGDDKFYLKPGESKDVNVNVFALENAPPGIYVGKILVKSGFFYKIVNVIIEVNERETLFDLQIEIPEAYKIVLPGKKILTTIKMINLGFTGNPVDVDLSLSIRDLDNNLISTLSKEVIAVDRSLSIIRELNIPGDINEETYLIVGELKYGDITASSYDTFEIKEKKFPLFWWLFFLFIVIILIVYLSYKLKKQIKRDIIPYISPFRKKKKK